MALAVTIRNVTDSINYRLQLNNVSVDYDRSALIAALPAGTNPLLIDLGFFKVTLSLEGIISRTGTALIDGGVTIADKDQLELAVRDWWNKIIRIDIPANASATTPTYDRYEVRIMRCKFTMDGAAESFWKYNLVGVGFLQAQGVT